MKKFKIILASLTLALCSTFAFAMENNLKQSQNNLAVSNQNQHKLPYKLTDKQKQFLNKNCGFDYEVLAFLENLIWHYFVNLGLNRFVYKDTIKKTVENFEEEITFELIFKLKENSQQRFELEYKEIDKNVIKED